MAGYIVASTIATRTLLSKAVFSSLVSAVGAHASKLRCREALLCLACMFKEQVRAVSVHLCTVFLQQRTSLPTLHCPASHSHWCCAVLFPSVTATGFHVLETSPLSLVASFGGGGWSLCLENVGRLPDSLASHSLLMSFAGSACARRCAASSGRQVVV